MPNTALLIKNPLAATHEFKQACQLCYPKTGNVTVTSTATRPALRMGAWERFESENKPPGPGEEGGPWALHPLLGTSLPAFQSFLKIPWDGRLVTDRGQGSGRKGWGMMTPWSPCSSPLSPEGT